MATFTGRLLRINLSKKRVEVEEIPTEFYAKFISGRGLGAKYLYKELEATVNPLGPYNKLIFLSGVLAGTGLQGFSKWCVMSKSPLTGTIFRSISGGNFGVWMKYAGYDMIIVEGKASDPTHLYINNGNVYFLDAQDIWGMDPRRCQKKLRERFGRGTESAVIGKAGELKVRYAVIMSGERTASRGGMGAVMGSKNLKSLSLNVSVRRPVPADPKRFKELIKKQVEIQKAHPRTLNMSKLGTPYITTVVNALGILPTKNFQEGSIIGIDKISGDEFYRLKKGKAGCYMCMTRCGGLRKVTYGPYRGLNIDGPEYESIYSFGPLLGIVDKAFIVDANSMCDFYGIDTISCGVSIAFAFELFEKGLIASPEADGLKLEWGNKEAVFSLIDKIGKREGIGWLLGEGVKMASENIGKGSEYYAMHSKGLELPGYDPRGIKGYALSMATSNIGGSHMYGRPRQELSGLIDPFKEEGKGEAIAEVQKEQALEDSLIVCSFGNSGMTLSMYSEFLLAATGIDRLGCEEHLLEVGERIICIERLFNVREGFDRKDDSLPRRLASEPLENAGPATGQLIRNLDGLLDEYYGYLDYTKDGIPSDKKIRQLDLESN